jgi:hypothetical protein
VVVHPDHRPLRVELWRRVVRNRELAAPVSRGGERIQWID